MADELPSEPASEITPFEVYQKRRAFLKSAGLCAATGVAWGGGLVALSGRGDAEPPDPPPKPPSQWQIVHRGRYGTDEEQTPFADVTIFA